MRAVRALAATIPLLLSLAATTSDAADATVTTLEWPPYTSPSLPQGGATTSIVRHAFENIEMAADVVFLPWKRAITMAKEDGSAIAYFPGYHCRHVEGFVAS